MNHSRPQTVLVTATQVPKILTTQTGVTLSSSRLRREKRRWEKMDLMKIMIPAAVIGALALMKPYIAFGAEFSGISITPPTGWEVTEGMAGTSLVMQEPAVDPVALEKLAAKTGKEQMTFRRNITVATIHKPSPIDEQRALELKDELTKRFGESSVAGDYQVTEYKFFNYRGSNDALVMYASMTLSQVPVMQMHILISGSDAQYLMTYTDLQESMTKAGNTAFEAAWNSMVSIDVKGEAPKRFDIKKHAKSGGVAAGVLVVIAALLMVRRRRNNPLREASAMLAAEAAEKSVGSSGEASDFMLGSSLATLPVAWNLNGSDDMDGDIDREKFDMPAVSSISNF